MIQVYGLYYSLCLVMAIYVHLASFYCRFSSHIFILLDVYFIRMGMLDNSTN